jgi:PAS domain-containing protein
MPRLKASLVTVLRGGPSQEEILTFQDRILWLRISSILGDAKSVSGAVLAFLDITESENEKQSLKRSEATLRAVLDSIGLGLVVVDRESKVQLSNAEARLWLGEPASLADVKESLRLGLARNDGGLREEADFPLAMALEGKASEGDAPFARQDGKLGHLEFKAKSLPESDGAVMAFRDVTERKRLELDLLRRLDFQTFVGKLAGSLVAASGETVEQEIARALDDLAAFASVEAVCLFQADARDGAFKPVHEGGSASVRSFGLAQEMSLIDFPYLASALALGQPVQALEARSLPPLARAEREFFGKAAAFPLLLVPLAKDKHLIGFLAFLRKRGIPAAWSEEEISVLVIAGNMFSGLLQRHRLQANLARV